MDRLINYAWVGTVILGLATGSSQAIVIDDSMARELSACLSQAGSHTCWVKSQEDLVVDTKQLTWDTFATLSLWAKGNIVFKPGAQITSRDGGALWLKSGMESQEGQIVFSDHETPIGMNGGEVRFYYHPVSPTERENKYLFPQSFSEQILSLGKAPAVKTYMLISSVYDLNDINYLHMNYALSQDIDASPTATWDEGKGFEPIKEERGSYVHAFSGNFDGDGHTISGLYINRPDEDRVGLFGQMSGLKGTPSLVENLVLKDFNCTGDHYTGALAGWVTDMDFKNVTIKSPYIRGQEVAGGMFGTVYMSTMSGIGVEGSADVSAKNLSGILVGTAAKTSIALRKTPDLDTYLYTDVPYPPLGPYQRDILGAFEDDCSVTLCIIKTSPCAF